MAMSVVFVDTSVSDYQSLLQAMGQDTEVVLLDPDTDGVLQIADWLSGKSGYEAIHIISHGSAGLLDLGSASLSSDNISTYADALNTIGQALTREGDLLLYGCNVAQGEVGLSFIRQLSEFTGADVAASNDLTGAAALDGDWLLEASTGSIEAASPFDQASLANYAGVLATFTGGSGNDTLTGTSGDDTLTGNGGNDTLDGGGGNDTAVFSGNAADYGISASGTGLTVTDQNTGDGDDGTDTLANIETLQFADKSYAVQTGTTNVDTLYGSGGSDALFGLEGNDTLYGYGGDDLLNGGPGRDKLYGGMGNDTLYLGLDTDGGQAFGEDGNDFIQGSNGNDNLSGGAGDDVIHGLAGGDLLLGGAGNDTLDGGDGDDTLFGGDGNDYLEGGNGNDYLEGGNGSDTVLGGDGDDTIYVSTKSGETDTLYGGAGRDTFVLDKDNYAGQSRIYFEVGATGDVLDISALLSASIGYSNGNPFDPALGYLRLVQSGADTVLQWDKDGAAGGSHVWQDMAVLLNTVATTLTQDNFAPLAPPDGSNAGVTLTGGTGNDTLRGGVVNDTLNGGDGNDTLYGYWGDDTLLGGSGSDTLYGGAGNDLLNLYINNGITDTDGGQAYGEDGNDEIWGSNGNDLLSGGNGNDVIYAFDGDDIIQGGSGDDWIYGYAGNDTLDGGGGSDWLFGMEGDDKLYISAKSGETDYLEGGAGRDTYVLSSSIYVGNPPILDLGYSAIADFEVGATGDVLDISQLLSASIGYSNGNPFDPALGYLRLVQSGADTVLQWDKDGDAGGSYGWQNMVVLSNTVATTLTMENFGPLASPDGSNVGVTLTGTAGSDTLRGSVGDDSLSGGDGNDTIYGYAGDDTLLGGSGSDTLYGGAGNDLLNLYINDGSTDTDGGQAYGEDGNDEIWGSNGNDLLSGGNGNDVIYAFDGDDIIQGGSGDDWIYGYAGNDTLDGNVGSDYIFGGAGDDTIYVSTASGEVDTLAGGAGRDTYILDRSNYAGRSIVTDFAVGAAGDVLDITALLSASSDYSAGNPFDPALGYLRLVQVGADTVLQWDKDGAAGSGFGWKTMLELSNTVATTLTQENFAPTTPPIVTVNGLPVVSTPIADQNATEDAAFSYIVPASVFTQPDAADRLSYSATLADGSALPSWLSFNAVTRKFTGTPDNDAVGVINVKVTVTDTLGATVSDVFSLTVNNTNDAPTLANAIADQSVNEDSAFNFTVPANAFADVDAGDTLTYTATLADGSALPSWLSFDPATRSFSGTPANDAVGMINVKVTATDTASAAVSDTFSLTVNNTNDAPTVANAIADKSVINGTALNFTVPADAFSDVDAGDTLSYSATLADGSALPSWLSFDPATRSFSGMPGGGDLGVLNVRVTATDTALAAVSDVFVLTVVDFNTAPALANVIADQSVNEDSAFSFTVPVDTFTNLDAWDTLTYSATLADGSALPSWLSFDPVTRSFSGTPDNNAVGAIDVKVIATDTIGETASDVFSLTVSNTNDAPTLANAIADQSVDEGAPFGLTLPSNTFVDVDAGDTLAYTATLADGSALPSWLSFDPATRSFSGSSGPNDQGVLSIRVTVTDASLASISDTFSLTVVNVNHAPLVENAIADQIVDENSAYNFTVPVNTIVDGDAVEGDTLTYSASLSDGSAMPTWLSFDPVTRSFSGTPGSGDVGVWNIRVTATDLGSATASDVFSLTVNDLNQAPALATPDVAIYIDTIGADVFSATTGTLAGSDADGDSLTYGISGGVVNGNGTVSRSGSFGTLTVNALTGAYIFMPNDGAINGLQENTSENFSVTVTDGEFSASANFVVNLTGVNDLPLAANAIPDQTAMAYTEFSYQFSGNTFTDAEGDAVISYSASLVDGSPLPSWLSFNAATRTFSGIPTSLESGTLEIKVTATDGSLASGSDVFLLTFNPSNNVSGTAGNDTLYGTSASDILNGLGGSDTLYGLDGNDILNGGTGKDTMRGGLGDDIYVVDNSKDVVVEELDAGIDTVLSSVTRTLGANQENLVLTGVNAINGTGNSLDNVITGNGAANKLNGGAGNDTLDGGGGNDTMKGGLGDDTYVVDAAGDIVTEALNAGIDTVLSSVTRTLGANQENLVLTGTNTIDGTGNILGNILVGNSADNVLNGKGGNDTLTGGAGNDVFVFDTALSIGDVITDFESGSDMIYLDDDIVAALAGQNILTPEQFNSGDGYTAAQDATDRIIYNTATGALYYDADGIGGVAAIQFATLLGTGGTIPLLLDTDFKVFP